jgi:hypothetical protein
MTLQASGAITIAQINAEFGLGNNLNAYRGVTWYTDAGGTGTFSSGALSMNAFYSKRATAPSTSHSVTEGSYSVTNGFSSNSAFSGGTFGSMSPTTTLGGRTIAVFSRTDVKGSTFCYFGVSGSHTGSWWTYGTYRGTTFYRANTAVPAGSYDSGADLTYWVLGTGQIPGFSGSGTYTLLVYP